MIFQLKYAFSVAAALLFSVHLAEAQDSAAHSAWIRSIAAKLEQAKKYPPQARKNSIEGYVIVRFTIDRSGKVIERVVSRTSCSEVLDQEALAAVRRASPFPRIPAHVQGTTVSFKVPLMFVARRPGRAAVERINAIRC